MTCEMLPGFCSTKYAPLLCRRSCNLCVPTSAETAVTTPSPTFPSWIDTCRDHVSGLLTCPAIPNVCDDDYGRLFCRLTCRQCTPSATTTATATTTTTTAAPTTTTTTTTTLPTTAAASEDCDDLVSYGMTCQMIPYVCSSQYAPLLCRRTCRLCVSSSATTEVPSATYRPWSETCVDHVTPPLSCTLIPNICDDDYGKLFCRLTCGQCQPPTTTPITTTTAAVVKETCVDFLGNGLTCVQLAGICSHPLGSIVCGRTCKVCEPNPNAVTSPPDTASPALGSCVDNLVIGLHCSDIPGVCHDVYGHIMCRHFCGDCVAETTTRTTPAAIYTTVNVHTTHSHGGNGHPTNNNNHHPSTTPMPTTPTPATTTLHWSSCVDHIGHGMKCGNLPSFCGDPMATLLCPHYCGFCVPLMETGTFAPEPADATLSPDEHGCADRVTNGLTCSLIPQICQNAYGQVLCQKFCGYCGHENTTNTAAATTTTQKPPLTPSLTTLLGPLTTTTPEPCLDNVGHGMTCDELPGACNDPLASILCRKTCGFCECEDHIVGMTCQDLVAHYGTNPCVDDMGHRVCAKFCGFC